KQKFESYDQDKYRLPANVTKKGSVLSLGLGLNGGAKYTFAGYGTIFFDASIDYLIRNIATASIQTNYYSPLILSFNLGFRKEFY
ncbi:MAG: hypothetical protein HYR91_03150, partial [Flavobacteriia bacterium]|nr:hypothetical protein [Flavobacteriia bacterium]